MKTILRRLVAFSAALSLCTCIGALSALADGSEGDVSQAQAEAPAESIQPESEAPAESTQTESGASEGGAPTVAVPAEEAGENGNGMIEEDVPGSDPAEDDPENPSEEDAPANDAPEDDPENPSEEDVPSNVAPEDDPETPEPSQTPVLMTLFGAKPAQAPKAPDTVRVNPGYATEQTADNAGTNAIIHPGSDLFDGADKIVVTITDSRVEGYQGSSYEFGKEKQTGNSLQNKNGVGSPRFPAFVVDSDEGAEVEIVVTRIDENGKKVQTRYTAKLTTNGEGNYNLNPKNGAPIYWFAKGSVQEIDPNPDKPTEPTDPSNPDKPTDPTEPSNPDKPTEPTDPTEPSNPGKPTDPTDPDKPTDPTEPSNPGKPTEPTDPDKPTDPTDPSDPGKPSDPTEPSKPNENPDGEQEPDNDVIIVTDTKKAEATATNDGDLDKKPDVPDEAVPLAKAPVTGDISGLWLALSSLSGSGMLLINRKRKKK